MFTVLTIENRLQGGFWGSVAKRLGRNSLRYRSFLCNDFKVNYLHFISRNGRVNWRRIGKKVSKYRGQVVYSGEFPIPKSSGFSAFVPVELRQRLCSNMALEVLEIMENIPRSFKVGLYDPAGDYGDFVPYLLKYTSSPVVVTKNMKIYSAVAQDVLAQSGAVLRPVRSMSALGKCDLIIAPAKITERFMPKSSAVVLTSERPAVSLECSVYHRYSFRLPKALDRLRPQEVDAEAFGGALYSLCKVYKVGSLVPFVCMNDTSSQTTLSLKKYFEEQFTT